MSLPSHHRRPACVVAERDEPAVREALVRLAEHGPPFEPDWRDVLRRAAVEEREPA
jgi:hypothetical protein